LTSTKARGRRFAGAIGDPAPINRDSTVGPVVTITLAIVLAEHFV
jgi:hypothetical protein